jgi:hypothetical protein
MVAGLFLFLSENLISPLEMACAKSRIHPRSFLGDAKRTPLNRCNYATYISSTTWRCVLVFGHWSA